MDNYEKYVGEKRDKVIKAWTRGVPFDLDARQQLLNILEMPFVYKQIAVMPDVHVGKGCTVGAVVPMYNAVIPAAVGVDIGCGMTAVETNLKASDLPDSLHSLRIQIEALIPHGRTHSGDPENDTGSWMGTPPKQSVLEWKSLYPAYEKISGKHPGAFSKNTLNHLGTLGSGNHFIEICIDEKQDVWLVVHSGSRGCGNRIGTYFTKMAQKQMEMWHIDLIDKDLAYLPKGTSLYGDYLYSMHWAQKFADSNRKVMVTLILDILKKEWDFFQINKRIDCRHNYLAIEKHFGKNLCVVRKGAIRAQKGDFGIIPGSMGERSFIVKGLGNPESFNSCSHGAGRVLSRTEAKKQISLEQHILSTKNVECKKDESVLDESPKAYKNIDNVMEAQKDLVEIIHTLKQVICVKG